MEGKIAWFDAARGYGFVEPADGGGDIFFTRDVLDAELRGGGPQPGDPVSFEIIDGALGPEAARVGRAIGPGDGIAG